MYKMKQKMAVILSAVVLMASLLPLTANAYTDREIRKMLGISTMEDMAMELVERDVLNQLNEGNMITITESDSSVISNAVFDTEYYADKYPDLKAAYGYDYIQLYNHFVTVGMQEGRQASANFNVEVYKANNPDLQEAFHENLAEYYHHFVNGGYGENRISC